MQTHIQGHDLLLHSIRLALTRRMIVWGATGLIVGALFGGPLLFIGATIAKDNATIGDLFRWLGFIVLLLILTFWMGTLAQVSAGELRGERTDLWKATSASIGGLSGLMMPFIFALITLATGVFQLVLFFVGRLPTLGDIAVGCLFVPLMLVNCGLVLIFFAGWWLTPGIVAIDGSGFGRTFASFRQLIARGMPMVLVLLAIVFLIISSVTALLNGLLATAKAMTIWIAAPAGGATITPERGGVLAVPRGFDPGLAIVGVTSEWNLLGTFIMPIDQTGALFSNPTGRSDQSGRVLGGWTLAILLFFVRIGMVGVLLSLLASSSAGAYLYLKETVLGSSASRSGCVNCGRPLPADARFCTNCGASQPG